MEGDRLGAGTLQGGQAVAELLEAHLELLRQQVEIVAAGARRRQQCSVGHEQCAGEITCQQTRGQHAKLGVLEAGAIEDGRDLGLANQGPQLARGLKASARCRQQGRQAKTACRLVKVDQAAVGLGARGHLDGDPVLLAQQGGDLKRQAFRRQGVVAPDPLGGVLDGRKVVALVVQEVVDLLHGAGGPVGRIELVVRLQKPHLIEMGGHLLAFGDQDLVDLLALGVVEVGIVVEDLRERADRRQQLAQLVHRGCQVGVVRDPFGQGAHVLAGAAVAAEQAQQGMAGAGGGRHQLLQILAPDIVLAKQRLAQELGQLGHEPRVLVVREAAQIDVELLAELEQ
jgi:hypothetical protein